MSDRKWFKGANGLWTSRDRVILRRELREVARDRIAGIRERLAALIERDGWKRAGNKWRRAVNA